MALAEDKSSMAAHTPDDAKGRTEFLQEQPATGLPPLLHSAAAALLQQQQEERMQEESSRLQAAKQRQQWDESKQEESSRQQAAAATAESSQQRQQSEQQQHAALLAAFSQQQQLQQILMHVAAQQHAAAQQKQQQQQPSAITTTSGTRPGQQKPMGHGFFTPNAAMLAPRSTMLPPFGAYDPTTAMQAMMMWAAASNGGGGYSGGEQGHRSLQPTVAMPPFPTQQQHPAAALYNMQNHAVPYGLMSSAAPMLHPFMAQCPPAGTAGHGGGVGVAGVGLGGGKRRHDTAASAVLCDLTKAKRTPPIKMTFVSDEERRRHLANLMARIQSGADEISTAVNMLKKLRRGQEARATKPKRSSSDNRGLCAQCQRLRELHTRMPLCLACVKHNTSNIKHFRQRYEVDPADDLELFVTATLSRLLANARHQCSCDPGIAPDCDCVFDEQQLTCIPCRFIRGVKAVILYNLWPTCPA